MTDSVDKDLYNLIVIDIYLSVIKRRELGFIDKQSIFVVNNLLIITKHMLDNSQIFTDEQYNNIINLINKILNGCN